MQPCNLRVAFREIKRLKLYPIINIMLSNKMTKINQLCVFPINKEQDSLNKTNKARGIAWPYCLLQ